MIKYILMSALLPLLPVGAQTQLPPVCLVSHEDLTEAQQKLFNVTDPGLLREAGRDGRARLCAGSTRGPIRCSSVT